MVQCTGAPTWSIATTDALNVTACLPAVTTDAGKATVTFTLIARAMVSSPTNRACGWAFAAPMRGGLSGSISISTADGLPVELMDFSIEDDSEPEQDETRSPD